MMDNDDVPYFPLAWREKVLQNQVKLGLEFSLSSLGAKWPILVQPGLKWNWVGWGVDFTKRKYIALSFFPIISLSFFELFCTVRVSVFLSLPIYLSLSIFFSLLFVQLTEEAVIESCEIKMQNIMAVCAFVLDWCSNDSPLSTLQIT